MPPVERQFQFASVSIIPADLKASTPRHAHIHLSSRVPMGLSSKSTPIVSARVSKYVVLLQYSHTLSFLQFNVCLIVCIELRLVELVAWSNLINRDGGERVGKIQTRHCQADQTHATSDRSATHSKKCDTVVEGRHCG